LKIQPPLGVNGEDIVGRDAAAGRKCAPPSFNVAGDDVNVFIAQQIFQRGGHARLSRRS